MQGLEPSIPYHTIPGEVRVGIESDHMFAVDRRLLSVKVIFLTANTLDTVAGFNILIKP